MKRVLVTRPEPGATETAVRLAALGYQPVVAPVLAITARNVNLPSHFSATVVTSRNALMAFPPFIRERPVFVVGTATATKAAEAGFSHIFNADGDAKSLANLVAENLRPHDGSLFLPTGRGQGMDLAQTLRHRGFHVIRRIAYHAASVPFLPEPAAANLQQGRLTTAMFFSAETSSHFARLVRIAGLASSVLNVEAVAISERAAVPLRQLKWRRLSVAAKPNQDAMLVLLHE